MTLKIEHSDHLIAVKVDLISDSSFLFSKEISRELVATCFILKEARYQIIICILTNLAIHRYSTDSRWISLDEI